MSSDSDYTSLAIKIREHGLFVIGIGKKETHDSFRRACDVFVSTENLGKEAEEEEDKEAGRKPPAPPRPMPGQGRCLATPPTSSTGRSSTP